MTPLRILSADEKLAEIRRLYFATSKKTITEDFANAVRLLKSLNSEEERERARVYMDGLAQMRSDWARTGASTPGSPDGRARHSGERAERRESTEGPRRKPGGGGRSRSGSGR